MTVNGKNFVAPKIRKVEVTLSLDTSIYAAGDVLADSQVVAGAFRRINGTGLLVGMQVLDKDDQAAASMTFYLLNANVSIGTENAAPSISDANATKIMHKIDFASTEFTDLTGCKIATKDASDICLPISSVPNTSDMYIAAVTGGTPTQTASGITVILFIQD